MASQKKRAGVGKGSYKINFYTLERLRVIFFFVRRLESAKEEGRNERDRTGPRGVVRV